jgi:hypothetical protein
MAWEFAYHILHKQANLVILLMAWLTSQHLSVYSVKSKEPDMDILAYWIARLEPLVRAEDEGEIIVILANRCGTEGETIYAGTSCVLGVEDGEVKVYGVLGRGDRDLLVVDTSEPPHYNLVAKPDTEILGQTAESYNAPAIEYDKLADRESIDPETTQEGQGLMGSINAVLAERTAFLRNQHQQNTAYAHMDAEMPQLEEFPGDFSSSIPAGDNQSPSTSISSSIASSVCEIEGLPSASSRTNTLDHPTAPEEQRQEMVQISPPESSELGIYGFRNGYPPESISLMEVNASCKSRPSTSRVEDIHRNAIPSSNRRVVPILTTQAVYSWDSSYLLDSGYPSDSVYLLDSAYPPDSAFHTDSAYPPESAYLPESASSTTVNVPWEQEQNRSYYGDEELIKIMKVDTPGSRNIRHKSTHVFQPFVSPMDNQPDSASPPDAAYSPNPAYPPESASSTKVNVPWEPEPDISYYKDKELKKARKVPGLSGASNSRHDSISIPQPFVSSMDNPTDSAYLLDFAYPPDSAYPPESAASMIVNVPWEPQPGRSYYGDEELAIVMKAPALSGLSNSNHGSTAISQLFISSAENLPDPACSIIVNKAYSLEPSVIDSKIGGVTKIMNYDTSTRSVFSATDNSPESDPSMRVNTSSSRDPSPFNPRRDRIIQIMANTSVESSIGHTSIESTEHIVSPTENRLVSAASMTVNTDWVPNSAELVVSQTDNPRESAISMIVNAVLESSLTQPVVTPIEDHPDSACSIMFNMSLVPSPGLFPGEDFVSPMATSKTSSSGHMSFPIVRPTSSSADLLQSSTSDWSMKYSDNSPISPESASSMLVNPSWDASPTFSTIEEIIKIAESPSSPVASRSSHESLPVAEPVPPRKERPLSPKLRNTVQTNNFQGNAALLFEELANRLVGASAATPAKVLRACASPHLTPDPMTNATHDGGLISPRFQVEEVQANPH